MPSGASGDAEPSVDTTPRAVLRDDTAPEAQPAPTTASTTTTTTTSLGTTTTVPAPVEPLRDPRRGSGEPVILAFGGDVHFEGVLRRKLASDPAGVLAPVAPVFGLADVAMVNLETAVTQRGAAEDKEYTFRTPGTAEAYSPFRTEVRGQRIAVFAATDVLDGNLIDAWPATDGTAGLASSKGAAGDRLATAVRFARLDSDTVVVYLHWGVEGDTCPRGRQRELARRLVDAGADIVVGGHAHRQRGAGRFGTAFVAYGLGNFAFCNEGGPSGTSGVLLVTATGRDIGDYAWAPAQIRGGVPEPLAPGADADAAVADWNALRDCAELAP